MKLAFQLFICAFLLCNTSIAQGSQEELDSLKRFFTSALQNDQQEMIFVHGDRWIHTVGVKDR